MGKILKIFEDAGISLFDAVMMELSPDDVLGYYAVQDEYLPDRSVKTFCGGPAFVVGVSGVSPEEMSNYLLFKDLPHVKTTSANHKEAISYWFGSA